MNSHFDLYPHPGVHNSFRNYFESLGPRSQQGAIATNNLVDGAAAVAPPSVLAATTGVGWAGLAHGGAAVAVTMPVPTPH